MSVETERPLILVASADRERAAQLGEEIDLLGADFLVQSSILGVLAKLKEEKLKGVVLSEAPFDQEPFLDVAQGIGSSVLIFSSDRDKLEELRDRGLNAWADNGQLAVDDVLLSRVIELPKAS